MHVQAPSCKQLFIAAQIGLSVIGMYPFAPGIARIIHILRGKAEIVNCGLGPAGVIVLHIADVYVHTVGYHSKSFKQSVQKSASLSCNRYHHVILLCAVCHKGGKIFDTAFVFIHLYLSTAEYIIYLSVGSAFIAGHTCGNDRAAVLFYIFQHLRIQSVKQCLLLDIAAAADEYREFISADPEYRTV